MDILREAAFALRQFAKKPGYTVAAGLSLSLAIGANSAIFSAVHAVVLRPMPISEPERLVTCWETDPEHNLGTVEVSYRSFRDWQAGSQSFAGLAAMGSSNWNKVLEGHGNPVRLSFTAVSASFFSVLGATPALGRTFLKADDLPGAERVVILRHAVWRERFGADPNLVGRSITLDKRPYTVVGVMPDDFEYPRGADFWTPLVPILSEASAEWKVDALEARGLGLLYIVGRLRPDATVARATQDLERITREERPAAERFRSNPAVVVTPLLDQLFGPMRRVLLWLFGAAALVLLVGCANVSGLMLTRATVRQGDDAIRLALGAGRSRVIRGWILEAGWLVLFGGVSGLLGAWALTKIIVALSPSGIPRMAHIAVDWSVIGFSTAVCALAALLCALAPAWRSAASDAAALLSNTSRGVASPSSLRSRSALVVLEIASAVVLLVAAGLTLRSFVNVRRLDLGYDPADVLTMDVEPQAASADNGRGYYAELVARVQSLSKVKAAGAVYLRPLALGPIGQEMGVILEGQPQTADPGKENPLVNYESATPGYFEAMRIPLLRGRVFDNRDDARAPKVAVIGESTARRLWPGQYPIGKRLAIPLSSPNGHRPVWHTVIGVVKDGRYRGLDDVRLDFYEASDQAPPEFMARQLVVRTTGDPLGMAGAVQAEARAIDRNVLVGGITTMGAIVERAMAPWRFSVCMFMLFALLAFGLATGGLFGIVALNVALRSREFAVRMALGARSRDISSRVLLDAGRRAALGVSVGVLASAAGTHWLAGYLFGVLPLDVGTYAAVVAVVFIATASATFLPAYRASRLDPMTLLREQ